MSRENVEVARAAIEAINRGDLDAALADAAPDLEYVASGAVPGAGGVYRGPEGFRRLLETFLNEFSDFRLEIHELIEVGDQVLVSQTMRGRGKQKRCRGKLARLVPLDVPGGQDRPGSRIHE